MFKFKGRRNIFISLLLIVTAVMLQFSSVSVAKPNKPEVDMSIEAGYDNIAKIGTSTPFYITLANKGRSFSGEAQVIVDTGYQTKTAYAVKFDLPEGSTKKLALNISVNTANKRVRVKIEGDGYTIKDEEHSFNKILSPETPVIGVLGEAYNQLGILKSIRVKQRHLDGYNDRYYSTYNNEIAQGTIIENSAEVFQLNEDTLPEEPDVLSTFDYIVIADYDTSLLSDGQVRALEKWLTEGNALILAGGANVKKVYSGLSNYLKPFEVSGSKKEYIAEALEKFTERSAPDSLVDVSTGNTGNGKILIGDKNTPLAVSYIKADGKLLFIAFDPTMSPISTWEHSGTMWETLISESIQPVYLNAYSKSDFYRYNSVVYQIREDQSPPYKILLLIILLYIIIVGPVLYIILKRKDKRDYSWVIVPALSLIFVGIIYVFGFRTRYTSAVTNNFSIINLDSDSKKAEIKTYSGIFNNKAGTMTLEYSKDYKVDVIRENGYNYSYNYTEEDYKNAHIKSKIYQNDPVRHEIFNVGLWEPCVLIANQIQNYEGNLFKSVSFDEDKFFVEIVNNTGFAFEDSLLIIGNNYVDVGNILPNEEKKISFSLTDNNVYPSFSDFISSKYYSSSYRNGSKEWRENRRRSDAFDNFNDITNSQIINGNYTSNKIVFVALNFENVDYSLKVNGKKTKNYNTNVVYATENLFFEQGGRVDIPKGVIGAIFDGGRGIINDSFSGPYNDGRINVMADSEIYYRFEIPWYISVDRFLVDWGNLLPDYMNGKYYQEDMAEGQFNEDMFEFYVYNNALSEWERTDSFFEIEEQAENYIDYDNMIKIKIKIKVNDYSSSYDYLLKPQIYISGVKK